MIQLLADANINGHVGRLVQLMCSDHWLDLWVGLDIHLRPFHELGLARDDTDSHVWKVCQDQQLCLLTNNRNDDGPDSLEATIRTQNSAAALSVFTFGDVERVLQSSEYAERVVESLYDKLLTLENLRGAGRLYHP